MLHPDELAAIAAGATAHGVRLISDEIYHGLNYDSADRHGGVVQPHAVVVNSFSKYFSMTGWRVGWLVLPDDLVRPVERLAQNLFISAPHISQIAAEAAFDCHESCRPTSRATAGRAIICCGALPEARFTRLSPAEGAFYLFADIADRSNDSVAFCARMLAEWELRRPRASISTDARGNRFVRFSYCGPEADMREAAERLKAWR